MTCTNYCFTLYLSKRILILMCVLWLRPSHVECKCSVDFLTTSGYFGEGRVVSDHMPLIAGPQMCADLCRQNSECNIVNVDRNILFCELRSSPGDVMMPNISDGSGIISMFVKPENVSKYIIFNTPRVSSTFLL